MADPGLERALDRDVIRLNTLRILRVDLLLARIVEYALGATRARCRRLM